MTQFFNGMCLWCFCKVTFPELIQLMKLQLALKLLANKGTAEKCDVTKRHLILRKNLTEYNERTLVLWEGSHMAKTKYKK